MTKYATIDRFARAARGEYGMAWHGTTILGVLRDGVVALGGDGQVTAGDIVLKHHARKIRALANGSILAGFAGAVADALTLFDKFEQHLRSANGDLRHAAVELAKEWRTDRYLRRLEAQLLVADPQQLLLLSGEGDVLEPDDGVAAIGTGGAYAAAAARALLRHTTLSAPEIVRAAMEVAADLCIYTNHELTLLTAPPLSQGGAHYTDDEREDID